MEFSGVNDTPKVDIPQSDRKRKRDANREELKWATNIIDLEAFEDVNEDLAKAFGDLKFEDDGRVQNANLELPSSMSVEGVKEKRKNDVKVLKRDRVYSLKRARME